MNSPCRRGVPRRGGAPSFRDSLAQGAIPLTHYLPMTCAADLPPAPTFYMEGATGAPAMCAPCLAHRLMRTANQLVNRKREKPISDMHKAGACGGAPRECQCAVLCCYLPLCVKYDPRPDIAAPDRGASSSFHLLNVSERIEGTKMHNAPRLRLSGLKQVNRTTA